MKYDSTSMTLTHLCVPVPGVKQVDQVLHILLTTNMFVGGFLGFFLDNTIPGRLFTLTLFVCSKVWKTGLQQFFLIVVVGTKRERGLLDREHEDVSDQFLASLDLYDLPFGLTSFLSSRSWVRYVPFCPQRDRTSDGRTEVNKVVLRQGRELLSQGEDDCDESVWW